MLSRPTVVIPPHQQPVARTACSVSVTAEESPSSRLCLEFRGPGWSTIIHSHRERKKVRLQVPQLSSAPPLSVELLLSSAPYLATQFSAFLCSSPPSVPPCSLLFFLCLSLGSHFSASSDPPLLPPSLPPPFSFLSYSFRRSVFSCSLLPSFHSSKALKRQSSKPRLG